MPRRSSSLRRIGSPITRKRAAIASAKGSGRGSGIGAWASRLVIIVLFYHSMHVHATNGGRLDDSPRVVRVAVYGSSCPACTQAKAVLDRYQVAYDEQPISALPRRFGRVRSMPQITIDGELLGGVNQLLKLARAGGLERITNDDPKPWVRIERRLGRGYDVVMLNTLGHEQRQPGSPTNSPRHQPLREMGARRDLASPSRVSTTRIQREPRRA